MPNTHTHTHTRLVSEYTDTVWPFDGAFFLSDIVMAPLCVVCVCVCVCVYIQFHCRLVQTVTETVCLPISHNVKPRTTATEGEREAEGTASQLKGHFH